jgi:hypothetical protein
MTFSGWSFSTFKSSNTGGWCFSNLGRFFSFTTLLLQECPFDSLLVEERDIWRHCFPNHIFQASRWVFLRLIGDFEMCAGWKSSEQSHLGQQTHEGKGIETRKATRICVQCYSYFFLGSIGVQDNLRSQEQENELALWVPWTPAHSLSGT